MLASRTIVRETPSVKHHLHLAVGKTSAAALAKSIIQEFTHQITFRPRVVKTRRKQEARTSSEIVYHRICRGSFWRQNQIRRRSIIRGWRDFLLGTVRTDSHLLVSLVFITAQRIVVVIRAPSCGFFTIRHILLREITYHKTSRHEFSFSELRWWVMVFYVTTRLMLFQVINFTQPFHFQGWSFDFKSRNVFNALNLILLADLAPYGHCQEWEGANTLALMKRLIPHFIIYLRKRQVDKRSSFWYSLK